MDWEFSYQKNTDKLVLKRVLNCFSLVGKQKDWRKDKAKPDMLKFQLGSETQPNPIKVWGLNDNFTTKSFLKLRPSWNVQCITRLAYENS